MTTNLVNPPKRLLLGPGPSNPDPRVLAAMAAPMVGHLDPYFQELIGDTMGELRRLFRTQNHHTIPTSGTGTAGLEMIALNLLEPGDEAVVGVIGYFGERLVQLCERAGAQVRRIDAPWGEVIDPQRIKDELERKPAKLVALVHAETSTGACQPIDEVGPLVRGSGALFMVDCVTSLGGMPVESDAWQVDAAGSCSQKCIGAPPGLGPVTLGPRALDAVRARCGKPSTWYLDVELLFKYWGEKGEKKAPARAFHHTAPVSSIYALREALHLIHQEGLEARFARHRSAHERLEAGLDQLGLSLFTPATHRLPMLNLIEIPDGVDDASVRGQLLDQGIEISGGFGPLAGRVWRVGLMGMNATSEAVDRLLGALGKILGRR